MSHLDPELLWESAGSAPNAEAAAHLNGCAACRSQLAQVQAAKALLVRPGPPPPLDPVAMRRIGAVLKEAAAEQLKPRAWWWPFDVSPLWAFAAVAAVVLAFLVWNQGQLQPQPSTPIAHNPVAPQGQQLAQVPPKVETPLVRPARPKLLAKVTSSRKAKSSSAALQKSQTLAEGTKVNTESGGALWLQLPDGSRAGLTGASEIQLDTLEEKQLGMTLARGDVLVMARHLPDRVLTVKAGEVEVRDIGTRFLVSRDAQRVLVAVEEGVVEVNAPGNKLTLRGGRSAEWREGRLVEQAWAPTPPPAAKPSKVIVSTPTPPIEAISGGLDSGEAVAAAAQPPQLAPVPVPVDPTQPDEDWAAAPNTPHPSVAGAPTPKVSPVPPAEVPPAEAAQSPEEEEASVLSLAGIEQRLKKVSRAVRAPFAAVGSSIRETRAREIGRLADEGNCEEALRRADAWLVDKRSESTDEPRWKRSVQVNQMRCYTRLHRDADATRLREQLQ